MFRFKQFLIRQNNTAMKVGTDGVLLGAWANIDSDQKEILDIGAGTGLIALMMAQRTNAKISAIEIEKNAYLQAKQNFENSKWVERLEIIHSSLQEFEPLNKFDLIVSNPPFFTNSLKTLDASRNTARHTDSLSFRELLIFTSINLDQNGKATFIIPYDSEIEFLDIAKKYCLFPSRICRVQGNENSVIKRSLIELNFNNKVVVETILIIEKSRHIYTQDYINLTKDFYIKM